MLEIVICDDNVRVLNTYAAIIEKTIKQNQIDGKIVCKADHPSIVEDHIKHKTANVFFLDIDLKSSDTGYTLAKKIRENNQKAYIVFITGHLEYILQAFKVKTFDFLPKPVSDDILDQCILDIYKDYLAMDYHKKKEKCIEVKSGSNIHRIKEQDIVFVEKLNYKSIIHLANSRISCNETLEMFEKILEGNDFIRCHKSFIANRSYISEVRLNKNEIQFETGEICYIGRTYKKQLTSAI